MIELYTFIGLTFLRMLVVFAVLMKLKDKFGTPLWIKVLFVFGIIYDVFLNHLLTLVFLDFPVGLDETVTKRMKRYGRLRDGSFKYRFSLWLCPILNKFDEGHC